jgi:hypothetical protein
VKGRKKKNIAPGQEPIIIGGGGSVNMQFPPSFMNMSTGPGRRFRNPIADLRTLIVVPGDGSRPKKITLFNNDTIYICFTGSDCPDVDAEDC